MTHDEEKAFDIWLREADREAGASVAASLDVENELSRLKRRAAQPTEPRQMRQGHAGGPTVMPEQRALFGVDVIGSGANPGRYFSLSRQALNAMLETALAEVDIEREYAVLNWENTGDGALLTLPSTYLGALVDAADRLDRLAAEHNDRHRPDIRLRLAVDLGPVADETGFHPAKARLTRLLNAQAFRDLIARCLAERPDGTVNSGLILSDRAHTSVFGGDHTTLRPTDFAPLTIETKHLTTSAWIRIPGVDPHTLTESTTSVGPPYTGENDAIDRKMAGIQAHTIHLGPNRESR